MTKYSWIILFNFSVSIGNESSVNLNAASCVAILTLFIHDKKCNWLIPKYLVCVADNHKPFNFGLFSAKIFLKIFLCVEIAENAICDF